MATLDIASVAEKEQARTEHNTWYRLCSRKRAGTNWTH